MEKFKHLIDLLAQDGIEQVKDVLSSLHNVQTYLFFYENLPLELKPDYHSDDYFAQSFYHTLCKSDNETFNHYLFSGLAEKIDILELRKEALKENRQDNTLLQKHVKTYDKPKRIDQIIILLQQNYQYPQRFEELLQEYEPQLKKINNITSPKSIALEEAFSFIRCQPTIAKQFELAKKIHVDILSKLVNSNLYMNTKWKNICDDDLDVIYDNLQHIEKHLWIPALQKYSYHEHKMLSILPDISMNNELFKNLLPVVESAIENHIENRSKNMSLLSGSFYVSKKFKQSSVWEKVLTICEKEDYDIEITKIIGKNKIDQVDVLIKKIHAFKLSQDLPINDIKRPRSKI